MKKMNAIARIPEISESMKAKKTGLWLLYARACESKWLCVQMRRTLVGLGVWLSKQDSIEDALREDGEEHEAAVEVQKVLEDRSSSLKAELCIAS